MRARVRFSARHSVRRLINSEAGVFLFTPRVSAGGGQALGIHIHADRVGVRRTAHTGNYWRLSPTCN